jgi:hypothetical protein
MMFDDIRKTTSSDEIVTREAQQTSIDAGRLLGALPTTVDPGKGADTTLVKEVLQAPGIR